MPGPGTPTQATPARITWGRALTLVLTAALMSLAQTLLFTLAVIQLIVMLASRGQPSAEIAAFGRRLGLWQGRSARFLTAASDARPWPWAPLE